MERTTIDNLPQDYCKFLVYWYQSILAAPQEEQPYGCMIPKKAARIDGYVRVSLHEYDFKLASVSQDIRQQLFSSPGSERTTYLHVIAFKALHGYVPDGVREHISHLCHEPACFFHEHLCVESAQVNNLRKNCKSCLVVPQVLIGPKQRKLVVVVCDGHGTANRCVIAPRYFDKTKYKLVIPEENPEPLPATVKGDGRAVKRARKTLWKQYIAAQEQ
jgi:hypothetical protein